MGESIYKSQIWRRLRIHEELLQANNNEAKKSPLKTVQHRWIHISPEEMDKRPISRWRCSTSLVVRETRHEPKPPHARRGGYNERDKSESARTWISGPTAGRTKNASAAAENWSAAPQKADQGGGKWDAGQSTPGPARPRCRNRCSDQHWYRNILNAPPGWSEGGNSVSGFRQTGQQKLANLMYDEVVQQ